MRTRRIIEQAKSVVNPKKPMVTHHKIDPKPKRLEVQLPNARLSNKQRLPDTRAWLTRNESVDLLNISVQTLRNYEQRGLLHPLRVPRKDPRGREQSAIVYDPRELANLPRGIGRPLASQREPGETAARAFEFFDEGKPMREIVRELREQPDVVQALHDKWLDMGGADLVISPGAKMELERTLGTFETVAELIEKASALHAASMKPS